MDPPARFDARADLPFVVGGFTVKYASEIRGKPLVAFPTENFLNLKTDGLIYLLTEEIDGAVLKVEPAD